MSTLPALHVLVVKVPVSDLAASRRWYADVFGVREELEWPDEDGSVRGVGFSPMGGVALALRENAEAARTTRDFGFFMVGVPSPDDLAHCASHLDALGVPHTEVLPGARGLLVGFHDPDGHEVAFYAVTEATGARPDAVRRVRSVEPLVH